MLKQGLSHKLLQKLSPQQIQLMKMVQLPTAAFEQRVEQELVDNPALEDEKDSDINDDLSDNLNEQEERNDKDDFEIDLSDYLSDDEYPSYKTESNNYSQDDEEASYPYAQELSFTEHLLKQIETTRLSEEEMTIAKFLVGNIGEDGYIRREIKSIANDLAFTENIMVDETKVEKILTTHIHKLDPIGVGARNLAECLMIQLKTKHQTQNTELACEIIEKSFETFANRHYEKLINKYNINEDILRDIIGEIEKLNPKPGKAFVSSPTIKHSQQITPDFTITIIEGELDLKLNGRNAPELRISNSYNNMLRTYKESKEKSKQQKDTVLFIKQKLDSAKWFIDAVKQRQNTLWVTMHAIMKHQKEYLLTGDFSKMKPLILKDIAEEINMDISTVSRVASSKYVNTPYGTSLIRDFFSESIKNDEGEDISTTEVKNKLAEIIKAEDKQNPLTDDKLTEMLKKNGYPIARRTIAKYRKQLNIPVARLRRLI